MPQTFRTLQSNLEDQKRQIDVNSLPKTIMDAIKCTEQLGLKYLWVDSLCIIQDSAEDKAKEISRMSNIYQNAYVSLFSSYNVRRLFPFAKENDEIQRSSKYCSDHGS